jgi:hypothetical protein
MGYHFTHPSGGAGFVPSSMQQSSALQNPSRLRLTHAGLPEGIKPFDLPDLLHFLRSLYGLRDEDICYLRLIFRKLRREDFHDGRICAIWDSVANLAIEMGVCTRRIQRIETRLQNAGLIVKTTTSNGRRFGRRAPDGKIILASGVNLAPLIDLAPSLIAARSDQLLKAETVKSYRRTVQDLIADIRCMNAKDALDAARATLPRLRPSEVSDPGRLLQIIDALTAILADFSTPPGQTVDVAPSDSLGRPYTKIDMNIETCTRAERRSEHVEPARTNPDQIIMIASPEFRDMIELYRAGISPFEKATLPVMIKAARELAQIHGVTGAEWSKAVGMIGEDRAAICIALADRNATRSDGFKVRNVAGCFIGMVRKETQGAAVAATLTAELLRSSHQPLPSQVLT